MSQLGRPRWLRWQSVCLQCGRPGFNPWVRKIPWRRKWHPTPIFLPGKSHGWRSLAGYSPRGLQESDTADWTAAYSRQDRQAAGLTDVSSAALPFGFSSAHSETSAPPWVQSQIKGFTHSPVRTPWPPCSPKCSDTDGSADMKEMTSMCKEASLDPQLAPQIRRNTDLSVCVGL